jgi:hypothetical protein
VGRGRSKDGDGGGFKGRRAGGGVERYGETKWMDGEAWQGEGQETGGQGVGEGGWEGEGRDRWSERTGEGQEKDGEGQQTRSTFVGGQHVAEVTGGGARHWEQAPGRERLQFRSWSFAKRDSPILRTARD